MTLAERIAELRGMEWDDSGLAHDPAFGLVTRYGDMNHIVPVFDPENDWRQCGVLLEELVANREEITLQRDGRTVNVLGSEFGRYLARGEDLLTSICLAWIEQSTL